MNRCKGIVTGEEHCLQGGFGSAVLEVLADERVQIPAIRMGLPERYYFEIGDREYLLDRFGLLVEDISKAIDNLDAPNNEVNFSKRKRAQKHGNS